MTNGQSAAAQLDANSNLKVVGLGIGQGSTTSGQTGSLVMGAVTTAAPSYTTAQSNPLSLDTSGNLRVGPVGPAAVSGARPVTLSSQYPTNATTTAPAPETISATGTTTAFTATLAAAASVTTYVCGVEIDAVATTAAEVTWTLTGTITGTMNFLEAVGTPTTANVGRNVYNFNPCIPASAANTAIVVNAGAAGTGRVAAISAWGYKL